MLLEGDSGFTFWAKQAAARDFTATVYVMKSGLHDLELPGLVLYTFLALQTYQDAVLSSCGALCFDTGLSFLKSENISAS